MIVISTYGDRGNLICLQRRLEWRGISCHIISLDETSSEESWKKTDLFLGGGAQDHQQSIVMKNLKGKKKSLLTEKIQRKTPALFTCALLQLLGKYYKTSDGSVIEGLGLLDLFRIHPELKAGRCVGNAILKITAKPLCEDLQKRLGHVPLLIGFENHGGCTYLNGANPLASVIRGFGNNRQEKTEGVFFENMIGSFAWTSFTKKPFSGRLAD